MTSRLFIALDIPSLNLEKLVLQRDIIYGEPNDIKWEGLDKLHITLKFLGDVGENVADLLINRMETLHHERINAKFNDFSFFKRNGSLKILFASFHDNQNILKFQKIVEDECKLLGFEKERRKFRPHLTLLRIKGNEDIIRLTKFNKAIIKDPELRIEKFSIIKSELTRNGSQYSKVKSFKMI